MKFIIPVIVGAIIGYITNWLAIKMLFRPHEEKKILGFHVPFTPGLIPKERARIAKSVGETVGVYLLSPEVVMNSLSINKVEGHIKKWIESTINKLKIEDRSIRAFIMNLSQGNYEEIMKVIKNNVTDFISVEIRKEKYKERALNFIKDHILHSSMDNIYEFIDERIKILLSEIPNSHKARELLKDAIVDKIDKLAEDKRKLHEILPEDFINTIKNLIVEYDEDIVNLLKEIIDDPQVETKIKEIINGMISQNMNKIISIFISSESISDKIYTVIKEYLESPQVKDDIIDILINVIDRLLESRVDTVFREIKSNIGEHKILNITDGILAYIFNEENQKKAIQIISEGIRSQELEIQNKIFNILSSKLNEILNSEEISNNINIIIDSIIKNIIDRPISSIVVKLDGTSITEVSNFSIRMFNYFIKNRLPHIVEIFDISKVVEDQINSYDLAFAEELILEIAHRELKAITWLGALLGGIMGILSPLLQMI